MRSRTVRCLNPLFDGAGIRTWGRASRSRRGMGSLNPLFGGAGIRTWEADQERPWPGCLNPLFGGAGDSGGWLRQPCSIPYSEGLEFGHRSEHRSGAFGYSLNPLFGGAGIRTHLQAKRQFDSDSVSIPYSVGRVFGLTRRKSRWTRSCSLNPLFGGAGIRTWREGSEIILAFSLNPLFGGAGIRTLVTLPSRKAKSGSQSPIRWGGYSDNILGKEAGASSTSQSPIRWGGYSDRNRES